MHSSNYLFSDLAKMANGAMSTLSGLKEEIELRVKERVERVASDMDLVTREEFDAIRELALTQKEEIESLRDQIERLEEKFEGKTAQE